MLRIDSFERSGYVLLEVLIAMSIFVILSGMSYISIKSLIGTKEQLIYETESLVNASVFFNVLNKKRFQKMENLSEERFSNNQKINIVFYNLKYADFKKISYMSSSGVISLGEQDLFKNEKEIVSLSGIDNFTIDKIESNAKYYFISINQKNIGAIKRVYSLLPEQFSDLYRGNLQDLYYIQEENEFVPSPIKEDDPINTW